MAAGLTRKRFDFKNRKLFSGPHLLGSLLIIAGLVALVSPLFMEHTSLEKVVGVGALALGMLIITTYKGTLIDFTREKWKAYVAIGGFKFGEWARLPEIQAVKLSSYDYRQNNLPNGISPTLSGSVTVFKLVLWRNDTTPFFTFLYTNRATAITEAKRLAFNLSADLDMQERL